MKLLILSLKYIKIVNLIRNMSMLETKLTNFVYFINYLFYFLLKNYLLYLYGL